MAHRDLFWVHPGGSKAYFEASNGFQGASKGRGGQFWVHSGGSEAYFRVHPGASKAYFEASKGLQGAS